jgi:hypothetical protein
MQWRSPIESRRSTGKLLLLPEGTNQSMTANHIDDTPSCAITEEIGGTTPDGALRMVAMTPNLELGALLRSSRVRLDARELSVLIARRDPSRQGCDRASVPRS